ncbi:hypothetical protein [Amycolatopsis samaneae]|uniref:Uncharacterized protein n=1 Tax=Amycolatopsis samaneae TaxID=664691 RepID=A0ABW5GD13_9PSEU
MVNRHPDATPLGGVGEGSGRSVPAVATGHRVTYVPGRPRDTSRRQLCRRGVVVGTPVADAHAEVTWVPVRLDGHAEDTEPVWIRADTIVDAVAV